MQEKVRQGNNKAKSKYSALDPHKPELNPNLMRLDYLGWASNV